MCIRDRVSTQSTGGTQTMSEAKNLSLHDCCKRGHFDLCQKILNETNSEGVNKQDSYGWTPLHIAADRGYVDIVGLLLRKGAEPSVHNWSGTPLHYAVENGHYKVIDLLLKNGADLSATDNKGDTGLHRAARFGYYDIFQLLLKRGAGALLSVPNKMGETPWSLLLSRGPPSTSVTSIHFTKQPSSSRQRVTYDHWCDRFYSLMNNELSKIDENNNNNFERKLESFLREEMKIAERKKRESFIEKKIM
eukprot:TRINITY_DN4633_c0_g1_i2.p1 TRINITY_DN4633_c0_g1~~TRINITY_DN4633_c0_g1_i2.p1  ORF type:complete len:248 (-),score=67.39 TRINITY_DN4633_c0_g1_i2:209-952(-)